MLVTRRGIFLGASASGFAAISTAFIMTHTKSCLAISGTAAAATASAESPSGGRPS
jgi:hypothetical protein